MSNEAEKPTVEAPKETTSETKVVETPVNKGGRPTKYRDDYPEKLLAFFDIPLERVVIEQRVTNKGDIVEVEVIKPARFPTVEGFCAHLKISKSTLHDWVRAYPLFSNALSKAKQMQMNHLIVNAMDGAYHAGFAKFMAMNLSDYREKVETKVDAEIKVELPTEKALKL